MGDAFNTEAERLEERINEHKTAFKDSKLNSFYACLASVSTLLFGFLGVMAVANPTGPFGAQLLANGVDPTMFGWAMIGVGLVALAFTIYTAIACYIGKWNICRKFTF